MRWLLLLVAATSATPRGTVEDLLGSVEKPKDATAVRTLDIAGISKFVLAQHWDRLTPRNRTRFSELLTQLLERRAFPKAKTFFAGLQIQYDSEKTTNDAAVVTTSVLSKEEGRVMIEYHLKQESGWKIEDVILDGVSLKMNLRSQVQKIISEKSFEGLIDSMKKKLEGGE